MYIGNSTNFTGDEAELGYVFSAASNFSQEVDRAIAKDNVEWTSMPPRTPHFRGLWESYVKSFKRHLVRVIGDSKFTFGEFSTVTTVI